MQIYSQVGVFFSLKNKIFTFPLPGGAHTLLNFLHQLVINPINIKALHCSLVLRTVPRFGRKGLPVWNKLTSKENPAYFEVSTSSPDLFMLSHELSFFSFFLSIPLFHQKPFKSVATPPPFPPSNPPSLSSTPSSWLLCPPLPSPDRSLSLSLSVSLP